MQKRRENILPFTIWLPGLDPARTVAVTSPLRHDLTLTTPLMSGLQVRIPAGSTATCQNGKPVTHLSIIPVPVDRPPFPLPLGSYFPVYLSVQPAGAYVSGGSADHLPELTPTCRPANGSRSGTTTRKNGAGTSTGRAPFPPTASTSSPTRGYGVWEFTGAMISGSDIPPWLKDFFRGLVGADPVNLGSGLWTYQKTDLEPPGTIPVALTRVYRPADSNSYSFGIGTTSSYDMRLWSQNNYQSAELILPDGSDIHYVRTSPGTGFTDAIYQAQNTPTEYYASTISWDTHVSGWDLRLRTGLDLRLRRGCRVRAVRDPGPGHRPHGQPHHLRLRQS